MTLLGLDIGSSSIKAGILRDGRLVGRIARESFPTRYDADRAEVDPAAIMRAIVAAIHELPRTKTVDAIALSVMAPSWLAMDKHRRPLTPVITHQDRRSVDIARQLLRDVGKRKLLRITGNLPFPGGISSTTCGWFLRHERSLMHRADLVGHLNTYLLRVLTGARVTDPSNASFMGMYQTLSLRGWSDEMCNAIGLSRSLLPDVREANAIGGRVTREAARRFHLNAGTPVLVGCMDGSAAMLLTGARPGQMLNISGSTDVLALCTDRPKPHEKLLTRAIGVGRRWLSVSTLAAAGSALNWGKDVLFADLSADRYHRLLSRLAKRPARSTVQFEPYLAGERTSVEQRQGAFSGLTLSATREQMLTAVIESLAGASAARIPLLESTGTKINHRVVVTGGVRGSLHQILHRDWRGRWSFRGEDEATLRGLSQLTRDL